MGRPPRRWPASRPSAGGERPGPARWGPRASGAGAPAAGGEGRAPVLHVRGRRPGRDHRGRSRAGALDRGPVEPECRLPSVNGRGWPRPCKTGSPGFGGQARRRGRARGTWCARRPALGPAALAGAVLARPAGGTPRPGPRLRAGPAEAGPASPGQAGSTRRVNPVREFSNASRPVRSSRLQTSPQAPQGRAWTRRPAASAGASYRACSTTSRTHAGVCASSRPPPARSTTGTPYARATLYACPVPRPRSRPAPVRTPRVCASG